MAAGVGGAIVAFRTGSLGDLAQVLIGGTIGGYVLWSREARAREWSNAFVVLVLVIGVAVAIAVDVTVESGG